jgi:DNA-binding MarR family transcriptional regulator
VPKPLSLTFDPIARADELWTRRWGAVPSMAAITSVMRAHQILLGQVDAVVKPYRLTFARYEALVLLTFSKAGELPLSKIGQRLMVHPTSVTNTVDRLEAAGLVTRRPNPLDGRGVLAAITPKGRDVVERATQDLMAMDFGLVGYDAEGCKQLFEMLRPLRIAAGDFEEEGVEQEGAAEEGAAEQGVEQEAETPGTADEG